MRMILMGTGTSHGVPTIGCGCPVCTSPDFRDTRNRCSAYIEDAADGGTTYAVIDTGPEFRIQALKFGLKKMDAVLITHGHADHLDGLDDLRVFSYTKSSDSSRETPGAGLPIYANATTIRDIRTRYAYIFQETQLGGGKPKLQILDCASYTADRPLMLGAMSVIPIPMLHGELPTSGYLLRKHTARGLRSIAYLTDCSVIPDESVRLLREHGGAIEHAVIDGLRETPHETHFTYLQAMEAGARIGAKHTWLTHICHNMSHVQIQAYCDRHTADFPALQKIVQAGGSVGPGYDGLELSLSEE